MERCGIDGGGGAALCWHRKADPPHGECYNGGAGGVPGGLAPEEGVAVVRVQRILLMFFAVVLTAGGARGQSIVSDVISGKLVKPEVGVYAWYELTDKVSSKKYFVRQAVVGKERVKLKSGFWVETEIMPQVGYPAIYKMLLTGPASDPGNVHKILLKEGPGPAQVVPVPPEEEKGKKKEAISRKLLGKEKLKTPQGEIEAEHVEIVVKQDKDDPGVRTEVWLNEDVRPMGIVRMVSEEGELNLQRYGKGGPDSESVFDNPNARLAPRTEVRVEAGGQPGAP